MNEREKEKKIAIAHMRRKKEGLTPKDKIKVSFGEKELEGIVEKNKEQIKKQVIAEDIRFKSGDKLKIEKI